MALSTSLPSLLDTLTTALRSASSSLPFLDTLLPPQDGISLLDTKNELLLSYIQHVVFLLCLKLRALNPRDPGAGEARIQDEVVKKAVELRVYMEKGVLPLERRLKYQVDKVLRAAEDAERAVQATESKTQKNSVNGTKATPRETNGSNSDTNANSDSESDSDASIDPLSHRPNPSAFAQPPSQTSSKPNTTPQDGIYRPPRITPTAFPTTIAKETRSKPNPKNNKSAVLDDFISTEFSATPTAEPSIGSTILSHGRKTKSSKERAIDAERNAYEESNFVRLPKESKADRRKKGGGAAERERQRGGYGGEEWRGLGEGVERIERLVGRKKGVGRMAEGSRKRDRDGDRGAEKIGERFEKRRKTVERRGR
jgi:U3 small nucleolar ribonucleoprotein protein LCP5